MKRVFVDLTCDDDDDDDDDDDNDTGDEDDEDSTIQKAAEVNINKKGKQNVVKSTLKLDICRKNIKYLEPRNSKSIVVPDFFEFHD